MNLAEILIKILELIKSLIQERYVSQHGVIYIYIYIYIYESIGNLLKKTKDVTQGPKGL